MSHYTEFYEDVKKALDEQYPDSRLMEIEEAVTRLENKLNEQHEVVMVIVDGDYDFRLFINGKKVDQDKYEYLNDYHPMFDNYDLVKSWANNFITETPRTIYEVWELPELDLTDDQFKLIDEGCEFNTMMRILEGDIE